MDCLANDEPDVTVLAVNSKTRFPSLFDQKPFDPTPENVARWCAAVEQVRTHKWSNLRLLHAGNPHIG